MLIHRRILGSDFATPGLLLAPRGGYSRVELIAELAVIVDGVLIDLRGAVAAASVVHGGAGLAGVRPSVTLSRLADGSGRLDIEETTANVASSTADSTVTTFPHALIGSAGQTAASTAPGSVTRLAGKRAAFTACHAQFQGWAQGLDALAPYEPQTVVEAGHEWLRLGGHVAAYMVAHDTTLTWAQQVAWAASVVRGAAGVTTPAQFYADSSTHTAPTGPVTWVNPATGARLALSAAMALTGTPPTPAQLAGGEWVTSIADGSWA